MQMRSRLLNEFGIVDGVDSSKSPTRTALFIDVHDLVMMTKMQHRLLVCSSRCPIYVEPVNMSDGMYIWRLDRQYRGTKSASPGKPQTN